MLPKKHLQERTSEKDNLTYKKLHEAIVKLKNRKDPGTDRIVNEMLKYGRVQLETAIILFYLKKLSRPKKCPVIGKTASQFQYIKWEMKFTQKNIE